MRQRVPKSLLLHADEQQREKQHQNGAISTWKGDQVNPCPCGDESNAFAGGDALAGNRPPAVANRTAARIEFDDRFTAEGPSAQGRSMKPSGDGCSPLGLVGSPWTSVRSTGVGRSDAAWRIESRLNSCRHKGRPNSNRSRQGAARLL